MHRRPRQMPQNRSWPRGRLHVFIESVPLRHSPPDRSNTVPVPGGPSPTRNDPAQPHVGNGTGAQPTVRVADLANPNIKPWAKEVTKRENDKVLAGGIGYSARSSCMPAGVPAFMGYAVFESIHFLQMPEQVTMIFSRCAGPPRLSRCATFGPPEAILVRRVRRPLRRRYACGRHRRNERQGPSGGLPHAAH
jgi:hypothetical protein